MTNFNEIPFDRIVELGQIKMLDTDLFTVSWLLGRYCNFKCSYCWAHGRSDTIDHRSTILCVNTIDLIKEKARANGYNSFFFSFSGGEPTLHPGYLDLLDKLAFDAPNTNYTAIHMTTNMSKPVNWFKRYLKRAKQFDRASITASYHGEFMSKKLFANRLSFLKDNEIIITINMVMVPEKFDELYKIALYFHRRELNVTLKPQSDPHAGFIVDGYTDEQLEILHNGMKQKEPNKKPRMQVRLKDDEGNDWFIDQAERFNAFNFNKFKGWKCESGHRSIIIREPCGSIKRSYSCHDRPLGNIETGFKLFDGPKECITPTCVSSADSKIPKVKI